MNPVRIGDKYFVPGLGLGTIEGYQGRYEGNRARWYARVCFDAHRAALVPLSVGEVLQ